jgi:holo-[acyl-carrier protein] synthase
MPSNSSTRKQRRHSRPPKPSERSEQARGPEISVGIDLVDVARLEQALEQWPRLHERVFTDGERHYVQGRARPGQHLAARWAAKEATFKALGVGWPSISWHDVQVVPLDEGRRPGLALSGKAAELAGDSYFSVSLSHDAGIAIAEVILVRIAGSPR